MRIDFETFSEKEEVSFTVPDSMQGWRLDRALGALLGDAVQSGKDNAVLNELAAQGLRAKRRLCERGLVLVAGHRGTPGLKLRSGQRVVLLSDPARQLACTVVESLAQSDEPEACRPFVVHDENGLAALFKPAGMHSVALAGSAEPSLEALLPLLLPPCTGSFPKLLNRLDGVTSGLVLAALNDDGARFWRRAETVGRIEKRYLAVIEGQPLYDFTVKRRLDTNGRIRTRVRHSDDPDTNRHTAVSLLAPFPVAEAPELFPDLDPSLSLMLVGCCIRKGARHQIRAHLAAAGHPLLGDTLYGSAVTLEKGFLLHHAFVALPEFSASCLPFWFPLLPESARHAGLGWLEQNLSD